MTTSPTGWRTAFRRKAVPVGALLAGLLSFACDDDGQTDPIGPYPSVRPNCVVAPAGVVSWWPGDDGSWDVVGRNHVSMENGGSFAPGMVQNAFQLDAVDDVIGADADSFKNLSTFSIEAWVGFGPVTQTIRRLVTLGPEKAILRLWGVNLEFVMIFQDGQSETASVPLMVDSSIFYHVAATYDGGTLKLYVDGTEASAVTTTRVTRESDFFHFGSPDEPLGGLLDEVTVYDRSLSSAEVQAVYQAGSNGKCIPNA